MPDNRPNYAVERRRLEMQKAQHHQTILKGDGRLTEIEGQKGLNTQAAELANLELDDEMDRIRANQNALLGRIEEIDQQLVVMVKEPPDG